MNKLPDINQDFSAWYQDVIYQAELADNAPVRGCIVIRPYGTALWEHIKEIVDKKIKETGHHNAIFPLFIPESFLKKEAEHVEGFSPELAVVTFAGGKELEEPLVVRPTSETIIHYMFAQWIKSWRDLPMKINQWGNVVRWEMRPRAFLRTTEFYWQEGHTAHETLEEAEAEVHMILNIYVNLALEYLAIPVVAGRKSKGEQFPGADKTFTFEALMADGKALQMGTSHLISQSFARAFAMQFQSREGKLEYPFLTSWAVTTRLIGALVMTHGDAKGLILPPRVAPIQVVIIPILVGKETGDVIKKAHELAQELKDAGVRVTVDDDAHKTSGAKFYAWELKGVPVRIEIGPRDLANKNVVMADRLSGTKKNVAFSSLATEIKQELEHMQKALLERARVRRDSQWYHVAKLTDIVARIDEKPGFYQTGWCQTPACEALLKEHKVTIRCLLEAQTFEYCYTCDKKSVVDVLLAKAY